MGVVGLLVIGWFVQEKDQGEGVERE